MRRFMLITCCLLAAQFTQAEGNVAEGAKKAALCAACHGPKGISINPLWPSIAGQHAPYLEKQIIAFRDGARSEPTMAAFVTTLSDADAADLAAYYASLSCK